MSERAARPIRFEVLARAAGSEARRGRLHTLQQMSPADRQAALNDPRFMQGLSPDEQSVLRGLDSVRNPSGP